MSRIRILLADANASMLAMLIELIGEEFEIVGAVHTGAETLRCCSEKHPDLILLDVVLDDMNGFDLGKKLRDRAPGTKVLYLSMYEGTAFVDAAFAAGASGYVFKSQANSDLLKAVWAVCRGEEFNPLSNKAGRKQA